LANVQKQPVLTLFQHLGYLVSYSTIS
jgi:hypothetical protein